MGINKKRNILIITYWGLNDALIQSYTLPYIKIIKKNLPKGSKIFLLTLDKEKNESNVVEDEIINISFKYKSFGFSGFLMWIKVIVKLIKIIKTEDITTIHSWCTPAGAMGYVLSVITGKELIIDSFEPHAEPMVEGKTWNKKGIAYRILFLFEKLQLKRAKVVICAVSSMAEYSQKKYGIIKSKYYSKPACVDLQLFSINNKKKANLIEKYNLSNTISCVYAGKFGGLYLEKETFEFFNECYRYWGSKFRVILLSTISDGELQSYLDNTQLDKNIFIKTFVPHQEIANYMGLADFAICPMKPLPSRRYGTPIKNGEYWALGLPVVITKNISDDSEIISTNKIGSIIDDLNTYSYSKSIKIIDSIIKNNTSEELYRKIRPIAEKYRNFSIAENVYKEIYGN